MEAYIIVRTRLTHVGVLKICINEYNMAVFCMFVCTRACLYTEIVNTIIMNELLFYCDYGLEINIMICV